MRQYVCLPQCADCPLATMPRGSHDHDSQISWWQPLPLYSTKSSSFSKKVEQNCYVLPCYLITLHNTSFSYAKNVSMKALY